MFSGKSVPSIMSPTAASVSPGCVGGGNNGGAGTAGGSGAAGAVAGGCVAQAASNVIMAAPAETRRRDIRFI
jgi:hypothetical protein